jgi:hypothetical protein
MRQIPVCVSWGTNYIIYKLSINIKSPQNFDRKPTDLRNPGHGATGNLAFANLSGLVFIYMSNGEEHGYIECGVRVVFLGLKSTKFNENMMFSELSKAPQGYT